MTRTLTLLLLLCAPIGWAQDDDVVNNQDDQATPAADTANETATAPASPSPTSSPFDYEASEQISEDLSVSFPVDI